MRQPALPTAVKVYPVAVIEEIVERYCPIYSCVLLQRVDLGNTSDFLAASAVSLRGRVELLRVHCVVKPACARRSDPPLPIVSLTRFEVVGRLEHSNIREIGAIDLQQQQISYASITNSHAPHVSVPKAIPGIASKVSKECNQRHTTSAAQPSRSAVGSSSTGAGIILAPTAES